MIDINFYMKVAELKKQINNGEIKDKNYVLETLESFRSPEPVIFNIETTNACNMKCVMCPRTTLMTRKVKTMNLSDFERIVNQLNPISEEKWKKWKNFAKKEYNISENEKSENNFFFYTVPRVITLHGFGEPPLDKELPQKIKLLSNKNIESYFSCNPANISIEQTLEMFENGLGYMKFSIESIKDVRQKKIRGNAANFTKGFSKILKLIDLKQKGNYNTKIIVTTIDLSKPWQKNEFDELKGMLTGKDVYFYGKSKDNKWYDDDNKNNEAVHWKEFCQFPWSSMSIMSGGEVVPCSQDYNCDINLGNIKKESLIEIWNGEKYRELRKNQIYMYTAIKCMKKCDMTLVGKLLK